MECPTFERMGTPPAAAISSGNAAAADEIVQDLCAGVLFERGERHERGYRTAVDQAAFFIHEKHPVRVAVERDAEIAGALEYGGLQIDHVLGLDRACRMVRKAAVELEVQRNYFTRQVRKDVWDRFARHAVARVNGDSQRIDLRAVDERKAVFGEALENVARSDAPFLCRRWRKSVGDQLVA